MKLISLLVIAITAGGCAPSSKSSIDAAVYQQKISSNPCAASSACSEAFDEALLKKQQVGNTDNNEFCNELLKREDGDLAICEVSIRDVKYQELISVCKSDLMQRLEKLSVMRNSGLQIQANFTETSLVGLTPKKFSTQIQIRDTSKGYLAVSGGVQPKQVILTFDDGPDPDVTKSVLNTLAQFGAKAHFFEVGLRIRATPELTRRIVAEGHTVGNHSWNHPKFRQISFEEGLKQIKQTHSLLHSVLGWVDPFFRFPYGEDTPQLNQVLYQNQMGSFKWSIDSNDWKMKNADKTIRTNLQVITDVMNQLEQRGRGIILLHDVHRRTAELLPELLLRISEMGYTTVMLQPADKTLKTDPPLLAENHLP